jgi:alanine dehydrogenase
MIVGFLKEIKFGANVIGGMITCRAVAAAFGMDYTDIGTVMKKCISF